VTGLAASVLRRWTSRRVTLYVAPALQFLSPDQAALCFCAASLLVLHFASTSSGLLAQEIIGLAILYAYVARQEQQETLSSRGSDQVTRTHFKEDKNNNDTKNVLD